MEMNFSLCLYCINTSLNKDLELSLHGYKFCGDIK